MKKLLSLMLALMLCALALPVCAEEAAEPAAPAYSGITVTTPIAFETFKQNYEAAFNAAVPGTTVAWSPVSEEDPNVYYAIVSDAFIGCLVMVEGENLSEIAVFFNGDTSENSVMSFLSIAGYAGAALLMGEGKAFQEAMDPVMQDLITLFTTTMQNVAAETLFGIPSMMSITPEADSTVTFHFIMTLPTEAAAE